MTASRTAGKGPELEEALKAYFWRAGYFVVRGVPYRVGDDDVTDIDLWLYERPAALTRRRLIVDAKNKQRPKSAERIIWSNGLRDALQVDGAIVATTDQRDSARRLAKHVGVTLLDGDAVTKLLQAKSFSKLRNFILVNWTPKLGKSTKDAGLRNGDKRCLKLEPHSLQVLVRNQPTKICALSVFLRSNLS